MKKPKLTTDNEIDMYSYEYRGQDFNYPPKMNELEIPQKLSVLDQSIYLARHIGLAVDALRPLVYKVAKEELWKDRFSSFGEYVESAEGLNYSASGASKLKTIEQFRLDNGFAEKDINGIAVENLYLSIKAGGDPKLVISRAQTLSRDDLKLERMETEPHPYEQPTNCKKCGLSKENHPTENYPTGSLSATSIKSALKDRGYEV